MTQQTFDRNAKTGIERFLEDDKPLGTSGASACLIGSLMCIFGGNTDKANTGNLYRVNLNPVPYDGGNKISSFTTATEKELPPNPKPQITFEKLRPMNDSLSPKACNKNTAWAYKGKMYIFGGYGKEPHYHSYSEFYFLAGQFSNWVFHCLAHFVHF